MSEVRKVRVAVKSLIDGTEIEREYVTGHGKSQRQDHLGKSSVSVHHVFLSCCHWLGRQIELRSSADNYVCGDKPCESLSYILLERTIISSHDCVNLKNAVSGSKKEALTIGLELAALVCAFFKPVRWAAYVLLVVMAAMWVIPDIRMSRVYDESRK
ncbi:MAG: hypothetical protein IKH75_06360 [Ruminococcus sp.]|nr:hypothetical protein [Ruminococcus sp.]